MSVFLSANYSFVPTVSQAIKQSTQCMCGCMCTLWGLMAQAFTLIKDTSRRQSSLDQMDLNGSPGCQHPISIHLHIDDMAWPKRMTQLKKKNSDPTFLWVGSVMFKLHMAVCGRPLVVFGSFRKERRPHGSWPISLI